MPERYIAFDVETPNYANDRMSAIGITVVENDTIVDEFATLVNPESHFDYFNIQLTGITPEMAAEAATHRNGVDLCDLSAGEQGLDCLSDLDLGSVGSDLEGVLLVGDASHGVLGNDRLQDDIMCGFH